MDYFKFLPEEIILDIFSRVPTVSVLECKLVCKTWRGLVHHPSFSKIHLDRLNHPVVDSGGNLCFLASTGTDEFNYFEYNDDSTLYQRRINLTSLIRESEFVAFVGSCNGLICLAQDWSVCICNPITREYVILPKIKGDSDFFYYRYSSGFGYVSKTNEYKVVGIRTSGEVYIYTLGSRKGWRKLGNFSSEFRANRPGILANGVLYWLDGESKMIVPFDLAEEKFCKHIPPPPLPLGCYWCDYSISVLDGFLYIGIRHRRVKPNGVRYYDIWMLKQKSVNREMKDQVDHQSSLWSREFTIPGGILFAVTKSDGVLTEGFDRLNIYDKKTLTSKTLVKFKGCVSLVTPHKNTFVSLKELGEEDTKSMQLVDIEERKQPRLSFQAATGGCKP